MKAWQFGMNEGKFPNFHIMFYGIAPLWIYVAFKIWKWPIRFNIGSCNLWYRLLRRDDPPVFDDIKAKDMLEDQAAYAKWCASNGIGYSTVNDLHVYDARFVAGDSGPKNVEFGKVCDPSKW